MTYSRILAPRRKVLHRRVAEALATLHAENLAPHHLALGLHYSEGEVWDQAVVHLSWAGARAVKRSANREALACFERALAALAHLPESRFSLEQAFEIRLELRTVLSLCGEIRLARARLCEAEALAERLNDDSRRGRVCAFMANIHSQLGELDEALAYGGRALEIAGRLGDLRLASSPRAFSSRRTTSGASTRRAVELATENLAALPADWVYEHLFGRGAAISLRSPLAGLEPGSSRRIRRGGSVRSRDDQARRGDAACAHHRSGVQLRWLAPPSQGASRRGRAH